MKLCEIEKAIYSIQQDIYESSGGIDYFNISASSNGYVVFVTFEGIHLWDSESDEREEINGVLEPIEPHLRRLLREELKKLSLILV